MLYLVGMLIGLSCGGGVVYIWMDNKIQAERLAWLRVIADETNDVVLLRSTARAFVKAYAGGYVRQLKNDLDAGLVKAKGKSSDTHS